MRIILKKKNNPSLWLISWAKQKAREVDKLRKRSDLSFMTRTYPFQDARRVVVRSYRTYTEVAVRGSGGLFNTVARRRVNPHKGIEEDWIIQSIEFATDGDPINAVGAGALGAGLKIKKRRFAAEPDFDDQLTSDETKTWDKVADAGLVAPLSQLWYRTRKSRLFDYAILRLPSELTNIGIDSLYVGRLELVYYERSTRMVTIRLREDALLAQNIGGSLPGGSISITDAAQLIFLTTSIDNFFSSRFSDDYNSREFFDETLADVPAGTALTTSWHTFVAIPAGTVPTADGPFIINTTSTQPIPGDLHPQHTMTFEVKILGTVTDGVASTVSIVDGNTPITKNNVFGAQPIRDLTATAFIVADMRTIIGSTIGEPANDISADFGSSPALSVGRWLASSLHSLPFDDSQAFTHSSSGGGLFGGGFPVLNVGPYKYPGDLVVRGELTTTVGDPVGGTCTVISSPYESLSASRTGIGKALDCKVSPYEGLFVQYGTSYSENGSYASSTLCSNDPNAGYSEVITTNSQFLFRFLNGSPFLFESISVAGSGDITKEPGLFGADTGGGPLVRKGTLTGTSFNAIVPWRAGDRTNLGSGASITEGPAVSLLGGKGMHTLFQAQKLDGAGNFIAIDVVVDPQSGLSMSSEGLFDASGNKIRDVPQGVPDPTKRVAGDSEINVHRLFRRYGGQQTTGAFRTQLVADFSAWDAHAFAGKGRGVSTAAFPLAALDDARISASDSGLPIAVASGFTGRNGVDINLIWFDGSQNGLFMADETVVNAELYDDARTAWLVATGDGSDQATISTLAAIAMSHLTVYYNNFASNDLVLSLVGRTGDLNDIMIIVEE